MYNNYEAFNFYKFIFLFIYNNIKKTHFPEKFNFFQTNSET